MLINVNAERGAGLVEVMVSLLILGVGLLGVLSLQAKGLGSSQRAVFITEAHVLTQDMADRILAYGSQGSNGNAGAIDGVYDGISISSSHTKPPCGASSCSLAQTKQLDAYEWSSAAEDSSLPSVDGSVSWDSANKVYTIRVMWDQDRTGATSACATPDASGNVNNDKKTHLTCFDMKVGL